MTRSLSSSTLTWLLVAALAFLGLVGCAPARAAQRPPETVSIVIPQGTALAQARGEDAYPFPEEMRVQPGQPIVITNDDQAVHVFFDLAILPGQTVQKTFAHAGSFRYSGGLSCSINKSGAVTVIVADTASRS